MPEGCVSCGDLTFEVMGSKNSSWLECSAYTGVALKVPLGIWLQDPNKYIFDFITKVDGELPEDTLDWKVDEEKVTAFENMFGPQGMLFSETYSSPDTIQGMGITREQWKEKYKIKTPSGEYKPDPIILLAVARDFWRKYPDAVVVRLPTGERRIIGWEHLTKLNELDKLFEAKKITKDEYEKRKKEILSTGREDPEAKRKQRLKEIKERLKELQEWLGEEIITEEEYKSKKEEILKEM